MLCFLCVVCCSLFVVGCVLVACCSRFCLFVVCCCVLFVVGCCLLSVGSCLLLAGYVVLCVVCDVCCSL